MMSPAELRPFLDELERFADGQMTTIEQDAFEERLQRDPHLREAYETYEQVTADLRWVAGHETLRHRLLALDRRLDQRQTALVRIKRRQRRAQTRWGTVFTVLVVVLLGLWFVLRPGGRPADKAWSTYYVADPGLPQSATLDEHRPLLAEAMEQYRQGHYPAALHALRRVPTDNLGPDTMLYYNGVFLLSAGDGRAARPYLRRVIQQPGSLLSRKARYHLAVAHWAAQQWPEARAAFREVAIDSLNPYRRAAQQVLRANVLRDED
ncbi:tetratricopeptide repeat protein [Hymenobacter chitinivorans]|uniref:Tetratricopeptide repeat protein n=1 Tax=Hymenobacter chitinivorans DSM 11115 TaxID=1121954 RepID=A0A2M9B4J6_9BACT|nr:tetratricopeptide repeat protein [Hymenobacter chitinivorans]PJJ52853.1 tetratricopeptide repeat protein [Hymenobacter chitinivorans DSM 11115]